MFKLKSIRISLASIHYLLAGLSCQNFYIFPNGRSAKVMSSYLEQSKLYKLKRKSYSRYYSKNHYKDNAWLTMKINFLSVWKCHIQELTKLCSKVCVQHPSSRKNIMFDVVSLYVLESRPICIISFAHFFLFYQSP